MLFILIVKINVLGKIQNQKTKLTKIFRFINDTKILQEFWFRSYIKVNVILQ